MYVSSRESLMCSSERSAVGDLSDFTPPQKLSSSYRDKELPELLKRSRLTLLLDFDSGSFSLKSRCLIQRFWIWDMAPLTKANFKTFTLEFSVKRSASKILKKGQHETDIASLTYIFLNSLQAPLIW